VGRGRWNPENDALPWLRYCIEAHWIQAASVNRRIRESERIWTDIEREVEKHRLPDRAAFAVLDAAMGLRIRNSSYRALLEDIGEAISNQVATTDLRAMVTAGLLQQEGKKRGTSYVAGTTVREIVRKTRAGRQRIDPSGLFDGA